MPCHLDMDAINKMYLAEAISKQTYINEAKLQSLSEEVNPEDEAEMIEMAPMDGFDGNIGWFADATIRHQFTCSDITGAKIY